MRASWRGVRDAVRVRTASEPRRSLALALALVLAAAIWIAAVPDVVGMITPRSALAMAIIYLIPLIVLGVIGTLIGARRTRHLDRMLMALRASEARARELIEESGDGILVSEASGRYVEANPALCRMLGYSRDQVLRMRAGDLTAPDDPLGNEGMDERIPEATGEEGILVERRYRKRDGSSLPVEVRYRVLSDGRQQRNVRDICERVRVEAALRESEE